MAGIHQAKEETSESDISSSGGSGAILDGVDSNLKATVFDLTNSNPIASAIVDGDGNQITSFGGGTQYTEGDTDASITGTAAMWEDGSDTLRAISMAKPLPVQPGTAITFPVSAASLPLPTGAATSAKQDTIIGHVDGIEGLLTTIDADTGNMASTLANIENNIGNIDTDTSTIVTHTSNSATSLGVLDDWDESDRAKVNPIAGQAGVQGASGTVTALTQRVVLATDVALPAGTNAIGDVGLIPRTSGGLSIHKSLDLDESEEEVKATAGQVYGVWFTNTASTTRWLKFYNDTAANVSVGTTVPVITIGLPGNTSDDISGALNNGGHGIPFSTAICAAVTTGFADNDTGAPGANEVIIDIFYK